MQKTGQPKAKKHRVIRTDVAATTVNCLGKRHTIIIPEDGNMKLLQHNKDDIAKAELFVAIGGEMPRCVQILKWWRSGKWDPDWKGNAPKELAEVRDYRYRRARARRDRRGYIQEYNPMSRWKWRAQSEKTRALENFRNRRDARKLNEVWAAFRELYPWDEKRNRYHGEKNEMIQEIQNDLKQLRITLDEWFENIYRAGLAFLVPFAITLKVRAQADGNMILSVHQDDSSYMRQVLRTHLGNVVEIQ